MAAAVVVFVLIRVQRYVDQKTGLPVDVSFARNSIVLNRLMETLLARFALLEPLVVLVKCLVAGLGLSDPARGGLGSYSVVCLCVAFLQHRAEQNVLAPEPSLASLLAAFLRLWGSQFNSASLGVSLHAGGSFFRKSTRGTADFQTALVLEDVSKFSLCMCLNFSSFSQPLDLANNVARATSRWPELRRRFCEAAAALAGGADLARLLDPPARPLK